MCYRSTFIDRCSWEIIKEKYYKKFTDLNHSLKIMCLNTRRNIWDSYTKMLMPTRSIELLFLCTYSIFSITNMFFYNKGVLQKSESGEVRKPGTRIFIFHYVEWMSTLDLLSAYLESFMGSAFPMVGNSPAATENFQSWAAIPFINNIILELRVIQLLWLTAKNLIPQ